MSAEEYKEYIRKMFMKGALDISQSYEDVAEFVKMFAGEYEAELAIK